MNKSISTWQPDASQMPANYVMPYTQGGPNPTSAQAATSLDPVGYLPGNEVPGNTDNGAKVGA